ncbi:MAG: SLC13 family permease [Pseudoclavibacter sp.]
MPNDLLLAIVLVVVFVVGSITKLNFGAVGFAAALIVGTFFLGEDLPTILGGWPMSLLLLFLGVTYLFSVASANGTISWIIARSTRLVQGRRMAIPLGLMFSAALMCSVGVPTPGVVAVLAPIGIRLAMEARLPIFVAVVPMLIGGSVGTFSPIGVHGVIAASITDTAGVGVNPLLLYVVTLGGGALVAALFLLAYIALGKLPLRSVIFGSAGEHAVATTDGASGTTSRQPQSQPGGTGGTAIATATATKTATTALEPEPSRLVLGSTIGAFLLLILGSALFAIDLGMLALLLAMALHLLFPREESAKKINWDLILLICGLTTYIGLLQRAGTIDRFGDFLTGLDSPIIGALLLCVSAGVISAFASSPATLASTIPLAMPLISEVGLPAVGLIAAVGLSATLVDATPFSALGGLTVAAAPRAAERSLFRRLLVWGLSLTIVAPIVTVLALVAFPGLF